MESINVSIRNAWSVLQNAEQRRQTIDLYNYSNQKQYQILKWNFSPVLALSTQYPLYQFIFHSVRFLLCARSGDTVRHTRKDWIKNCNKEQWPNYMLKRRLALMHFLRNRDFHANTLMFETIHFVVMWYALYQWSQTTVQHTTHFDRYYYRPSEYAFSRRHTITHWMGEHSV